MITNITLKNDACFPEQETSVSGTRPINFIFGPNGSGKTTISRILAGSEGFPNCQVDTDGSDDQTLVYNRDFVSKNFSVPSSVKGIFVLGEEQGELVEELKTLRNQLRENSKEIESYDEELKSSKSSLAKSQKVFEGACWRKIREGYKNSPLEFAMKGFLNSKASFASKIEGTVQADDPTILDEEALARDASAAVDADVETIPFIGEVDGAQVLEIERNQLFQASIVGASQAPIATFVEFLGNSDWVDQGRSFLKNSDGHCPFCQQSISNEFVASLESYFDEDYLQKRENLNVLLSRYRDEVEPIESALSALEQSSWLDERESSQVALAANALKHKMATTLNAIVTKTVNPATKLKLDSSEAQFDEVNAFAKLINQRIGDHNFGLETAAKRAPQIKKYIWQFFQAKMEVELAQYRAEKEREEQSIKDVKVVLDELRQSGLQLTSRIETIQQQVSGTDATISRLNQRLKNYGFSRFKIAKAPEDGQYSVVREDGRGVDESLSEGETTFLTFLYFLHLLEGGQTQNEITNNLVVVIDDPISSLDDEILFIVSSLIRSVYENVLEADQRISQLFVSTHNVRFYKEISRPTRNRTYWKDKEASHYVLKKRKAGTEIQRYSVKDVPIKSAYDQLWDEIRSENPSLLTLPNTMRRILEYYVVDLCGKSIRNLACEFEDDEHIICNALVAWTNAGSHRVEDQVLVAIDDNQVQLYKSVFRAIFVKVGQEAHHDMMIASSEDD